ncbi:unnamed protein product, partial [Mesorhabditis belari]|uniref:SH2 domain-containing protein n=1 Tax=Mesorhabditis belari TaxID=2138241 RepID=A0AAF3FNS1_9BILA
MSVLKDILEKGYVDPEILEALDEEQKQMLFIQMRQEQMRKYQLYEEQLERDGLPLRKQKKKGVRWRSGVDGDVWVWVMGDHPEDKSIEEILEEEARREARTRALQELEHQVDESMEEALKAQLGNLRVGLTGSVYDDSDLSWEDQLVNKPPLLLQPQGTPLKSPVNGKPTTSMNNNGYREEAHTNEGAATPQKAIVTTFSIPTPQVAVIGAKGASVRNARGPPPPVPVRPAQFPSVTKSPQTQNVQPLQTLDLQNVKNEKQNGTNGSVRLRAQKALTPEEASDEVNKRESEIFQTIREKHEQLRKEAEAEAERERLAWEEQERKSREAEAAIRSIAQKAREQHRQLLRTSTSILPALADTKATSLREAIKNLPRPPRPKNKEEIVTWFKKNELPRGTGLDPKTGLPAPWFHGIISRDASEQLLVGKPTGSFLVRVSERIWGYTVSYVVGNGSCKHFLIERIEQGYQFLGTNQIVHDSLFDLIVYHESAPITAKGGEILKWFVGQIGRPADYIDLFPEPINNNHSAIGGTLQKGDDARPALLTASQLLNECLSDTKYELTERQACLQATTSALRVIFEQAVATNNVVKTHDRYAQIIISLFGTNQSQEFLDVLQWKHLRPLISSMLYILDQKELNRDLLLEALEMLLTHAETALTEDLYNVAFLPGIGKLTSTLLTHLTIDSLRSNKRVKTVRILSQMLSKAPVHILTSVLPGTLSKLSEVLCDPNSVQAILTVCLMIFKDCILSAFLAPTTTDKNFTSEGQIDSEINKAKSLLIERNEDWRAKSTSRINSMIRRFSANLVIHDSTVVRLQLLDFLRELSAHAEMFGEEFQRIVIDTSILLANDEDDGVKEMANQVLLKIKEENQDFYSLRIHTLFSEVKNDLLKLPEKTICSRPLLSQVLSLVKLFPDFRILYLDGTMAEFITAVARVVRVDIERLNITSSNPTSLTDFILAIPLKNEITMLWVQSVCHALLKNNPYEVFSMFADLLKESDRDNLTSFGLILSLMAIETQKIETTDAVGLRQCVEVCQTYIDGINIDVKEMDHKISDTTITNTSSVALLTSMNCAVSTLIGCISDVNIQNLYLVDVFCMLLLGSTIPNFVISTSSDLALQYIAQVQSVSLSTLLEKRDVLIIHKMWHWKSKIMSAPKLLTAFILRTDSTSVFNSTKKILRQMLTVLDEQNEIASVTTTLCAMSVFVESILKWFPKIDTEKLDSQPNDYKNLENEDGNLEHLSLNDPVAPEKEQAPEPILMTEEILRRTQHFLFSPHVPVKVECLRLLSASLRVVRLYEDVLLPMIHQNWSPLKSRLNDVSLVVRSEAVKVLTCYCQIAGSFVYRRVSNDAWPQLTRWAQNELGKSQYTQSEKYRLLFAIVSNSALIWSSIGYKADDADTVLPFLEKVSTCFQCPNELRLEAINAINVLKCLISNDE